MINIEENKNEFLEMIKDTSQLLGSKQSRILETAMSSNAMSDSLVNNVEFWSWMNRNYSSAGGGMFSSNEAMKEYIRSGPGKAIWMEKQLQGKGYEFDWVQKQRHNILNIFKKYDLGDVSNQPAIDVIEKDLLTGKEKFYQMKAYTSKSNPDLHNTGKEVQVVTNAEKADIVRENGYQVESYKNSDSIKNDILERQENIESGAATPTYTIADKIRAPCFGRGDYRKVLGEARYYQSIESMYVPFMQKLECAARECESFANSLVEQNKVYNNIREKDKAVTKALKDLYDLI